MTTLSSFSEGGDPPGAAALPSDIIIHRRSPQPIVRSASKHADPLAEGLPIILFKNNKFVVTGITALLENKIPFFSGVKGAAGQLPVHQVPLLALVAIG